MAAKKLAVNAEWPIRNHQVDSIFLDPQNIRQVLEDKAQDAIIQDLFSNEDAFEIAKSIVRYGVFPDELPIVVKEGSKIVVVEGNRRIAAMKALNNPDRVPLFREKLTQLRPSIIRSIKIIVAPSREAALTLIANKHTINLRRPWKPLRQAYFYKSQIDNGKTVGDLKREYPEHDVPKFIRMLEAHHLAKSISFDDEFTTHIVHDERRFPITNLERMYEDAYVTSYLGISFNEDGFIRGNTKIADFREAYKIIIRDVASGAIDSRKYNQKDQRKKYIDDLPTSLRPKKSGTGFNSGNFKEIKEPKGTDGKERSKRRPKGLIPSWIPFKLESSPLRYLYDELRDINIKKFPNASHDLLRTFLECSVTFYLKSTQEYKLIIKSNKHNPKLSEMLAFIASDKCTSITDSNLKQTIEHIKSNYNEPYSVARLNMINHNENWSSTEKEVRAAWSRLEVLIKYLINPKNNNA